MVVMKYADTGDIQVLFYLNDEVNQGFEVDFGGTEYAVFYKIAQCVK